MKEILIIFLKNPILGKVKKRLAKDIGNENTLIIYKELIKHTLKISHSINCPKVLYFSDFIVEDGIFPEHYKKQLQIGVNLGKRMYNAIKDNFSEGFNNIILVGSDIYDLDSNILIKAFDYLKDYNIVIGPSFDGGYYLLGMNNLYPELFFNKDWGSNNVFESTIKECNKLNLKYKKLQTLNDIDYYRDLQNYKSLLKLIE